MRFALTLLSLILHHLTAGAAVEPKVISGISTPKIALIANDRSETTKTLLDLAQVELSNDKGLALLERQAIDRVLTEQKLSLSGLVDGNTAVKVGRLLRVDLFAIVETWGAKNEAFAVIVYDAGTGMKFADQSLPEGGKLADHVTTIVEAVRMAVDKRGQGLKNLKTLSVMGVRNADLPRDRDTTCRSLAMIFERRVLGSLNIGILERKRLELLNKEKQLPTEGDNQQLLTSLLVLDLEFGRAKTGKGLRAIAIVSDGAGKELHRVSVEGKETAGADVVEPLVLGLLKYLKGTSYPKPVDRVREANRFVREGEIAWSHKDRIPAIEAMEAGYALDSSNPETRAKLAIYLSEHGARTLHPLRTFYGGRKPMIRAKPEDVNLALRSTIRSLQFYIDDISNPPELTAKGAGMIENRYMLVFYTHLFNNLGVLDERDVNDEGQVLREELRETLTRSIQAEAKAWSGVLRKDPAQFGQFSIRFNQRASQLNFDHDSKDVRILRVIGKSWLELSLLPGIVFDLPNLPYQIPAMIPCRPEFMDLYEQMSKHPHPVFHLHGMRGILYFEGIKNKFGPADYAPGYQKFKLAAQKAIEDAGKLNKPSDRAWIQAACYRIWYDARFLIKWEAGTEQMQEGLEVCEFMLNHKHIVREVLVPQVEIDFEKDPFCLRKLQLLERALTVIGLPENRNDQQMRTARAELYTRKTKLLVLYPELRKLVAQTPVPWTSVSSIFTTKKYPDLVAVRKAVIVEDFLYAAVLGRRDNKTFVQLVRVKLPDGEPELLGKADIAYQERSVGFMRYDEHILTDICFTKDKIYVATFAWGILAFDREGKGAGYSITTKLELPANKIQSCIAIDGKIYAGLEGGYLVEIDPQAQRFETLASSRRKEKLSPFDDGEAFRIPYFFADPQRDRIVFILYQRPDFIYYPANTKFASPPTNGVWEYNYKTKRFAKHLDLFKDALNIGTLQDDGRLLLACHRSQMTSASAVAFNLRTNRSELLWAGYPPGPSLPRDSARSREYYETMGTPYLLRNGWIWFGFGRFSLDTGKQELFPQYLYKPDSKSIYALEFLLAHSLDELILGDAEGIWLFKLKPEEPIPSIKPNKRVP